MKSQNNFTPYGSVSDGSLPWYYVISPLQAIYSVAETALHPVPTMWGPASSRVDEALQCFAFGTEHSIFFLRRSRVISHSQTKWAESAALSISAPPSSCSWSCCSLVFPTFDFTVTWVLVEIFGNLSQAYDMENTILSVICYLISAHLGLTMVFKEDLHLDILKKVLGHSSQHLS